MTPCSLLAFSSLLSLEASDLELIIVWSGNRRLFHLCDNLKLILLRRYRSLFGHGWLGCRCRVCFLRCFSLFGVVRRRSTCAGYRLFALLDVLNPREELLVLQHVAQF